MNINKAKEWLESYIKLRNMGDCGRLLSKEFKEYEKEKPRPNCGLLTWCVENALKELQ